MTSISITRYMSRAGGSRPISDTLRVLLAVLLAVVVGVVCGRLALSHYSKTAIELLVAGPFLYYIAPRPFLTFVVVALVGATIFAYSMVPRIALPGHPPVNVADAAIAVAVGATLWRRPVRNWPPAVRSFAAFLACLLVLALPSSINLALHGHAGQRSAILGYKTLAYMAIALVIALEFRGDLWRPVLNFLIGLCAVVSVVSLLALVSGSVSHLVSRWGVNSVLSGASIGAGTRIRVTGLLLIYAMTFPTLVLVLTVKDRWRPWRIGALALMLAAIGVSLNRNMYAGVLVGLLVTLLLGGAKLRHTFLIGAGVLVVSAVLIFQTAAAPGVAQEVGSRAQTALSTQVLSSGSAQARADEFAHAIVSIRHHPWYGVGWLQSYGDYVLGSPRDYVEDFYLNLATDLGLPVTLAWLLIPAMLVAYGIRRARQAADAVDRALVAAFAGSIVALLLSCLVGTYLQDPNTMMIFGISCGLLLAAGLRAVPRGGGALPAPGLQQSPAVAN